MGTKKRRYKTKKELEEELKEKSRLVDEYLDDLRRLKAEFENYKKRVEKERTEFIESAEEALVKELLPVLDNFERGLDHSEKGDPSILIEGMRLIKKDLLEILKKRGLVRLNSIGLPFDPRWQEAVMQKEAPDFEEGIVIEEVEPCYKLGERLLRPARVIISKTKGNGGKDG